MPSAVRKAVIPAAGLGTRFLPVTKASPKEMLPVVDRPAIQYVVEEAVAAGLDDVLVVTSREKRAIEDHFDRNLELEAALEAKGKTQELALVRELAGLARMHYVRQGQALGLGHAVSVARDHVGDEPFAVLLGDDIMVDATVLTAMVGLHAREGGTVIALKAFPPEEISAYGCVRPEPAGESLVRILDVVEKPAPAEAPSNLAIMGRYVFGPEVFTALEKVGPGRGGEIQLTDAIGALVAEGPVYGYVFEHGRYDTGNKVDYLRANVELALARDDLGAEMAAYLGDLVRRRGL
jgi:UTP--glucose-1-phosphate uridylyltransferase